MHCVNLLLAWACTALGQTNVKISTVVALRAHLATLPTPSGRSYVELTGGVPFLLDGSSLTILPGVLLTISGDGQSSTRIDGGGLSSLFSVTGGDLELSRLTLSNGRSNTSGGALSLHSGTLTINEVAVNNCSAAVSGGGINIHEGSMQTKSLTIASCYAHDGGAVAMSSGGLDMSDTTIIDSSAERGGGAFSLKGGTTRLTGAYVQGAHDILTRGSAEYSREMGDDLGLQWLATITTRVMGSLPFPFTEVSG